MTNSAMNKKLVKFLMKGYLGLRKLWDTVKEPTKVREEYNRDSIDFQERINSFEYKADPFGGLFDHTADPNKFFEDTRKSGRDCDDFQRQWSWWGYYNNYISIEYVICDPTTIRTAFRTMHVIGVLKDKNNPRRCFLTNYRMYGPFENEDKALDYMKYFESYKKDRVWVKYKEIK